MTDDDEPLNRLSTYFHAGSCLLGGVFFFVAGLIGYDTGRRSYGPGMSERSRWIGEIIWIEVALGVAVGAYGWWRLRAARQKR